VTGARRASTVLSAPAKLTLSLRVTGVRPDGFHLLASEMVTLDLADRLEMEEGDGLSISTGSGPLGDGFRAGWPPRAVGAGSDNLVVRALAAVGRSARVRLIKRVPPGAGLGGGSADAAAVFRWAGCTDLDLASGLGADVPFCVAGGRALVQGVGEEVTPLPFEDRSFVLVLLPFGVDTGAVYRAWDRLAEQGGITPSEVRGRSSTGAVVNDLEAPALVVEPRLAAWRSHLHELTGQTPHLAGSGSTWFVEGTPRELGLDSRRSLRLGGDVALVVPVRTTPAIG
jgi:4-diphosphocytidyl-2-C-methyl-D-erythritol kinase